MILWPSCYRPILKRHGKAPYSKGIKNNTHALPKNFEQVQFSQYDWFCPGSRGKDLTVWIYQL